MAFNIFKKEEKEKQKNEKKAELKKNVTAPVDKTKKTSKKTAKDSVSNTTIAAKNRGTINVGAILTQAHITEKASRLAESNQYVFQITPRAVKREIAKAVENYYHVDVVGVNIVKIPGKKHRYAKGVARKADLRKAIVKIKQGQKIELLPR